MRKIKWWYFQNVSQINEAKSLINNVFSPCNYAAVITLRHRGPISIQAWLKNLTWDRSFSQSGIGQTVKTRGKYSFSTRRIFNTFTWQRRSMTRWLSAQLQNITTPAREHLCLYRSRTTAALFVQDKHILGWWQKAYWYSYIHLPGEIHHTFWMILNI